MAVSLPIRICMFPAVALLSFSCDVIRLYGLSPSRFLRLHLYLVLQVVSVRHKKLELLGQVPLPAR